MRVNGNGKPVFSEQWGEKYGVSCKWISRAGGEGLQQRSLGYARDDDTRGGIVSHGRRIECLGEAQFAIAA